MSRCALLAALAGLLGLASGAPAQGNLLRVEQAIHPGPKYFAPQWPKPGSNGSWFGKDPGAELGTGAGTLLIGVGVLGAAIATAPLWGPHEMWDAGFDQRGWFPPNPYIMDDRPYMVIGDCPKILTTGDDYFDDLNVKPWALRVSLDYGNDFDDLSRFGGQLFLDTSVLRLGFLANVNYYRENLPGGRTDDAFISDYNVTWRVTQSERLMMHLGAGLRLWDYDHHTDPGFNALYRFDVFPVSNVHVAGIFESGTLRSALVLHVNLQAGFTFSHGEVFVGYDWLRVKQVSLQGPSVGLRLWF